MNVKSGSAMPRWREIHSSSLKLSLEIWLRRTHLPFRFLVLGRLITINLQDLGSYDYCRVNMHALVDFHPYLEQFLDFSCAIQTCFLQFMEFNLEMTEKTLHSISNWKYSYWLPTSQGSPQKLITILLSTRWLSSTLLPGVRGVPCNGTDRNRYALAVVLDSWRCRRAWVTTE